MGVARRDLLDVVGDQQRHRGRGVLREPAQGALLRDGGLVAAGPIAETLTSQNLTRTFGLPLVVEQRGERFTARSLSLD